MLSRRKAVLAITVFVAGLAAGPVLAADSKPAVLGSKQLKASRQQVYDNCQQEGDIVYGTSSEGEYGCARPNGAGIHCQADGNCEGNGPTERSVSRSAVIKKGGNAALPPARN